MLTCEWLKIRSDMIIRSNDTPSALPLPAACNSGSTGVPQIYPYRLISIGAFVLTKPAYQRRKPTELFRGEILCRVCDDVVYERCIGVVSRHHLTDSSPSSTQASKPRAPFVRPVWWPPVRAVRPLPRAPKRFGRHTKIDCGLKTKRTTVMRSS